MIQGFSQVLHDYTDGEVTEAFKRWMNEASILPTPADIIGIAAKKRQEKRKIIADKEMIKNQIADRYQEGGEEPEIPDSQFEEWLKAQKEMLKS